jgi:catechol 2,3-dioxygenase-like lactoylglutathione lyase family enzyme
MAKIPALQSITPLLPVRDLDLSIEFYVRKLGFTLEFQDPGFAGLVRDACRIFLSQKEKPDVDLRNVASKLADDGWANFDLHINCARGTVDELWREFKAAGVPMHESFANGPVNRSYGLRDFSVLDPDGFDLVFAAEIEPDEVADE